tara:strand:+ start:2114 stop:2512 length:399 start_codon:yes stop_codon:yes gene_type:complete
MVVFDESYAISNFSKSAIKIHIPEDIYINMVEIDAINSKMGPYFDICLMDNKEILYAGPLAQNVKQITLPKWISRNSPFYIYLTPNKLLYKVNGTWVALKDDITISFRGYKIVPEVDYEPSWEDDTFKEEWS